MSKLLIKIYAVKNSAKANKPLKFNDFNEQEYYINPDMIEWIDAKAHTIHMNDHDVFKVWYNQFDNIIKEIQEYGS